MKLDPITLSIPLFFILIGVELWVSRRRGVRVYRFNDSINDLACGILSQVWGLFAGAVLIGNYAFIYEHARILGPWDAENPLHWIACFIGVDFFYYWYHRFSHESAFGWAFHVVHHQSEEYNLAVALRQGSFQPLHSHLFYLPLAVVGFPPIMWVTCSAFNTLYQFWIHTRLVGKLGFLEAFLNTPNHHRIHHGTSVKCLEANYGGTFIVFDRLFRTFVDEKDEPRYGTLEPLHSWNPVWAHFHSPWLLVKKVMATEGVWNKVQAFFRAPGWSPPNAPVLDVEAKVERLRVAPRYDSRAPQGAGPYVLAQFVVVLLVTVGLLFGKSELSTEKQLLIAAFVVWSLIDLGGLFERATWVAISEILRMLVGVALVGLILPSAWWAMAALPLALLGWFVLSPWRREMGAAAQTTEA